MRILIVFPNKPGDHRTALNPDQNRRLNYLHHLGLDTQVRRHGEAGWKRAEDMIGSLRPTAAQRVEYDFAHAIDEEARRCGADVLMFDTTACAMAMSQQAVYCPTELISISEKVKTAASVMIRSDAGNRAEYWIASPVARILLESTGLRDVLTEPHYAKTA
ncbi:MAG: hypothetical protein DI628_04110 [Blastochloris viridis]|uniref:Uncharacterized protein n=1 Tax=Blastochloris viridis TaxID=1079 RepID=A0A6N4R604_BLAVI|nr:MAG: hypothetical protein DI628_04110 [Blastochloris viridis]